MGLGLGGCEAGGADEIVKGNLCSVELLSRCLRDFYMTSYDYLPTGKLRVRVFRKNTEYNPATFTTVLEVSRLHIKCLPGRQPYSATFYRTWVTNRGGVTEKNLTLLRIQASPD